MMHPPAEGVHETPVVHALPHELQFAVVPRLTHDPLQATCGDTQFRQFPLLHTPPAPQPDPFRDEAAAHVPRLPATLHAWQAPHAVLQQ
jgi:hypothetical protein